MNLRFNALIAVSLLAGCAKTPPLVQGAGKVQVVNNNTELPPPGPMDMFERNRPYLVGPFDQLTISVFGIEELSNKEVQVDASGRMSFPLAGVIEVAGHTPAEIEKILVDRLRGRFLRNPQITVNLKQTVSQVVTVDGQVKEPGLYPVVGRMTLMRAVATAKGLDEYAKLDDVVVFRTVNGQRMAALYNLQSIRRGYYDDPEIFANDIVVVGESKARRIFKDILQATPALLTPLIYILK